MHNKNTKLSKFQLSNEIKTSFEIGQVIPFYWRDTVPGDIWRNNTNLTIRFLPLIAPVMHKLDIHCHFYYTPYRLLDKNFKEILAKPESPLVSKSLFDLKLNPTTPYLDQDNLLRAFGIHSLDGTIPIEAQKLTSQYFLRAYHLIYNYYYKHEILDNSYIDDMDSDDLDAMGDALLNIGYARHGFDYFMSSLPNTQYGSMVELDMDGNAQIRVDEMRLAEKLQYFKEQLFTRARGRYKQFLDTFFGVSPTNYELQIPKYLGGGSQTLAVADIDQTANYSIDNQVSPLGSQAGKINNDKFGFKFEYKTEEHGIILGLCYVLPRASYVSGVPREFIKPDFYSFYNPTFANLGMQETYGLELSADRLDTFGYNERYAELKHSKDVIAGDFEKLTSWHFGIDLRNEHLSKDFIHVKTDNTPFAVQEYADFDFPTYLDTSKYIISIHTDSNLLQYFIIVPKNKNVFGIYTGDGNFTALRSIFSVAFELLSPGDFTGGISVYPYKYEFIQRLGSDTGDVFFNPSDSAIGRLPFNLSPEGEPVVLAFGRFPLAENDSGETYYTTLPNSTYLQVNSNLDVSYKRTVVGNHLLLVAYNDCDALRPIPKLAKPSIMI